MKPYHLIIDTQGGNDDVSIVNAMKQLRESRAKQPQPPPLPPKPVPRQKKKR